MSGLLDRHRAVLRQYLAHLRHPAPTQSTRPRMCDVKQALEAALAADAQSVAAGGEVEMEAWHSAVDDASELFSNAPDDRYANRASRVVTWIKANRPNALATQHGDNT